MSNVLNNLSLRVSAAAVTFASTTVPAFAQEGSLFGPVPDVGGGGGGSPDDIRATVLSVLSTILSFMALVAVIFIVIAGIRLVVSQGEESEKDKAKKTIIYVIVGLVVIILAQAIVDFIATEITTAGSA